MSPALKETRIKQKSVSPFPLDSDQESTPKIVNVANRKDVSYVAHAFGCEPPYTHISVLPGKARPRLYPRR